MFLNNEHILHNYILERSRPNLCHKLRPRRRNKELITKTSIRSGNDFIIRMLYNNIKILFLILVLCLYAFLSHLCSLTTIKRKIGNAMMTLMK